MSIEVLGKATENTRARAELRKRGLDCITPWFERALLKTRIIRGVKIGDLNKSWDILNTLQFIDQRVAKPAPILDIGAYASEILCSLHKMGFTSLTGIDLNPNVGRMPHPESIRYVVGDFTRTMFAHESFDVITAISVLEHGFDSCKLLREISRILKPGGYFVGSVDYWPDKINTSGVRVFGLDWRIFSKEDLVILAEEARNHDLFLLGDPHYEASETTVSWSGREYTFAWFAYRKGVSLSR